MRSPRSLFLFKLNKLNSLNLPSWGRCFSPLIIFVALLWASSNSSVSFLYWRSQAWTQYSRWNRAEQKGTVTSLTLTNDRAAFGGAEDTVEKCTPLSKVQMPCAQHTSISKVDFSLQQVVLYLSITNRVLRQSKLKPRAEHVGATQRLNLFNSSKIWLGFFRSVAISAIFGQKACFGGEGVSKNGREE